MDSHDRLLYAALYLVETMDTGKDTTDARAYYDHARANHHTTWSKP